MNKYNFEVWDIVYLTDWEKIVEKLKISNKEQIKEMKATGNDILVRKVEKPNWLIFTLWDRWEIVEVDLKNKTNDNTWIELYEDNSSNDKKISKNNKLSKVLDKAKKFWNKLSIWKRFGKWLLKVIPWVWTAMDVLDPVKWSISEEEEKNLKEEIEKVKNTKKWKNKINWKQLSFDDLDEKTKNTLNKLKEKYLKLKRAWFKIWWEVINPKNYINLIKKHPKISLLIWWTSWLVGLWARLESKENNENITKDNNLQNLWMSKQEKDFVNDYVLNNQKVENKNIKNQTTNNESNNKSQKNNNFKYKIEDTKLPNWLLPYQVVREKLWVNWNTIRDDLDKFVLEKLKDQWIDLNDFWPKRSARRNIVIANIVDQLSKNNPEELKQLTTLSL